MSAGTRVGVKICGINDAAALDAALDGGADWIGLVFFSRSPRAVTAATAAELGRRLERRAQSVGLFVEPTDDEVARALDAAPLDILQLYASAERATVLREKFGRPVWLAHGVRRRAELPAITPFEGLVIEAKAPENSDRPGGNGARFDWSIARGWTAPAPWLLAGGLTPGNVAEAITESGAVAVDVSSGVETAPGRKDPVLIREFIAAARAG